MSSTRLEVLRGHEARWCRRANLWCRRHPVRRVFAT
ncbi:phosphatase PAP2 family protein, partial [Xanthomonas perforans]